jgi:YebC/PmpR family DNA-binding regulatory protein
MSGHSKWASIKHKKAATDAKRGAAFTKLIREITCAAKDGGGSTDTNPRLRTAIDRAKGANMPASNIDNAIKKGTGELPGIVYEEVTFDAYGQGGTAMLIVGLTDNKNRTTAEIRNILNKKGGSMAGPGSTAYLFSKKGLIAVDKKNITEDALMDIVLDAGAEDIDSSGDSHEITCEIGNLEAVKNALKAKNIATVSAEMAMIPSTTVSVVGNDARQLMGLMEALEDQEDVQNVYANCDIPDEEIADLEE